MLWTGTKAVLQGGCAGRSNKLNTAGEVGRGRPHVIHVTGVRVLVSQVLTFCYGAVQRQRKRLPAQLHSFGFERRAGPAGSGGGAGSRVPSRRLVTTEPQASTFKPLPAQDAPATEKQHDSSWGIAGVCARGMQAAGSRFWLA